MALLASTLVPVETPGGGTVAAAPERANISIDALLPSWRARVEWGLDRFAAAGIELPPMEVIVHPHKRPCDGNSGLYQPGPPVEVHLCLADAASRAARMITLHELAHAWAETHTGAGSARTVPGAARAAGLGRPRPADLRVGR